ncbi:methyl-accepting chemotaxis protein, partial [Rhizobium helianthi]
MRATIKAKLTVAFSLVIVMLLATAGLAIYSLAGLNSTLEETIEGPAARLKLAQQLNLLQLQQLRQQKNMLLATDAAAIQGYASRIDALRKEFANTYDEVVSKATEKGMVYWNKLKAMKVDYLRQDDQIRAAILAGDMATANRISSTENRATVTEIDGLLEEVISLETSRLNEAKLAAAASYEQTRLILISVAVAALIIAVAAAVWIAISINRGLRNAVTAVQSVAEGDLTRMATVTTKDEIGDLLGYVNTMIERLRGVVSDALSASDNVSSGSQELSASSEQLSQGATEQASAAEQASASMEEMAANIKQNADNAAQTEKIARQSSRDAEASGQAVSRAVG